MSGVLDDFGRRRIIERLIEQIYTTPPGRVRNALVELLAAHEASAPVSAELRSTG
jgi:hypothetical protein